MNTHLAHEMFTETWPGSTASWLLVHAFANRFVGFECFPFKKSDANQVLRVWKFYPSDYAKCSRASNIRRRS